MLGKVYWHLEGRIVPKKGPKRVQKWSFLTFLAFFKNKAKRLDLFLDPKKPKKDPKNHGSPPVFDQNPAKIDQIRPKHDQNR
jgi:hypothetical protein